MTLSVGYRLEWVALTLLRSLARVLPEGLAHKTGAAFGRGIGVLWRRRRQIASSNLATAFPGWSAGKIDQVTSDVFANIGITAFEILRIDRGTRDRLLSLVECAKTDVLTDVYRQGRGALLMSGHFGNWELLAGWVRALGFPLDVVVKPMRNPLADEFYNSRRHELGVDIIHTRVATREIVRAVHAKRFVAILADQHAGEEGVEVEFFGRKVSTPRGPAALSLKFGCPIFTGVLRRKPEGGFHADLDGPVEFRPTGDTERDITALTQIFTTRLEDHIRRCPDQWLWTHRRWRNR